MLRNFLKKTNRLPEKIIFTGTLQLPGLPLNHDPHHDHPGDVPGCSGFDIQRCIETDIPDIVF